MAAKIYQFVKSREEIAVSQQQEFEPREVLPELQQEMLEGLFDRLSPADKVDVLQNKIIPVAYFPHRTLYAAAGELARDAALAEGKRVVAAIGIGQLALATKYKMGAQLLHQATFALRGRFPNKSAFHRITTMQSVWIYGLAMIIGWAFVRMNAELFYALASLITGLFFLAVVSLRALCLLEGKPVQQKYPHILDVDLPVYSVLVPLFRETAILNQLMAALMRLSYPTTKLDIKLILEETDTAMQRAVAALFLPEHFDVIVVPAGKPQTKPRALNYALQFARGNLLTIYDAEDIPEPLQLRKAAEHFAASPKRMACLQAELTFYNPNENWLTRQFTVEYAALFKLLLPAFVREKLPLPLGGTSNHFRSSVLRAVGAWDPYNVTEDADLGIRLARMGYATAMLDSVTYEEASSGFSNWLQQRSRWLKGFLQTWLVHARTPFQLVREIGLYGAFTVHVMTLGVFGSALLHPILLFYTLFKIASGQILSDAPSLLMTSLIGLNLVVFCAGYGISLLVGSKALRRKQIFGWWKILLTMPIYWFLISIAGWCALWQFICRPHHWNKTVHGQSRFQKR